jgi:hypothetical protein
VRNKVASAVVVVATITFCSIATADDGVFYRLRGASLSCLFKNADNYMNSTKDNLIIAVEACPVVVADPVMFAAENTVPDLTLTPDEATNKLIVLKKSELKCLAAGAHAEENVLYIVYPEGCRIERVK